MADEIVQVDAFTDRPFAGNPAAVALLTEHRTDDFLQQLALEMNLSETAFPMRRTDGDWDLRWFTPATEVDLCGHATLATAHVLFERGLVVDDEIRFHTRSGVLRCRRAPDGRRLAMDFPAAPAEPCPPIAGLTEALGVAIVDQGLAFDLIAEVSDPHLVASMTPRPHRAVGPRHPGGDRHRRRRHR